MAKGKLSQYKTELIAGGIALLAFCVIFLLEGLYPFGRGSVIAIDLNSQYLPLLYRFYDIVKGTKGISYDFHIAGGINLYSDALTELLNPVNYLLLLFKRENLYLGVNILVALYGVLSAITAAFSLRKISDSDSNSTLRIILSLTYSLSFFCAYQYEIIRWMWPVVLFPVFFIFINRLLSGESVWPYSLMLGYLLIESLQIGFMAGLFTLVYAFCHIFFDEEAKIRKEYISSRLIIGTVLGILISAVGTVPNVLNLTDSMRSSQNDSLINVVKNHGLDDLPERILDVTNPVTIALLLFLVVIFIKRKNIKAGIFARYRADILALLGLLITVILEPSNLLWHMGSYRCFPVRYAFMILLLSCVLIYRIFCDYDIEVYVKNIWPIYVLSIVLTGIVLVFTYINRLNFAQAFSTLAITTSVPSVLLKVYLILFVLTMTSLGALFAPNRTVSKYSLCIMAALIGITMYLWVFLPPDSEARILNEKSYIDMHSSMNADAGTYREHVPDVEDWPLNYALITHDYSMTGYIPSGESRSYAYAMNSLGYETPWISVRSSGGDSISDFLFDIGDGTGCGILVSKEAYEMLDTAEDGKINSKSILKALCYDAGFDAEIISSDLDGQKNLLEKIKAENKNRSVIIDDREPSLRIVSDETKDGILLLPFAVNKGISADKEQVLSYFGGLAALEMTKGVNDIRITFRTPGALAGICLSILGILLSIAYALLSKPKNEKGGVASKVLLSVGVCFGVFVYLVPNIMMVTYMGGKLFGKELFAKRQEAGSRPIMLQSVIEEDGMHVVIGYENLMLDRKVKFTADSSENDKLGAKNAKDGNRDFESRWSSENNWDVCNHYLEADFGKSQTVNAVRIVWGALNAKEYSIESSVDGKTYETAASFDRAPDAYEQVIVFEKPIDTRFLRIHVTDVNKFEEDLSLYYQSASVKEFEAFGADTQSFIISEPVISGTENRLVPVPSVPDGMELCFAGVGCREVLKDANTFRDNISAVEVELGYVLNVSGESFDLPGFKVVLPKAGDETAENADENIYGVKEFEGTEEMLSLEGKSVNVLAEDAELEALGLLFKEELHEVLGDSDQSSLSDTVNISLGLIKDDSLYRDEAYRVDINKNGEIKVYGGKEAAIRWGLVTLKEMLKKSKELPCGCIIDYPEYEVRGFCMDVARRPVEIEFLKDIIREMSDAKMNTLQLHLNDNEILSFASYDKTLTGAYSCYSAFRLESEIEGTDGSKLTNSDFYYTKDEFAKLVEFGKLYGVSVIPEIDTPSHALSLTKIRPDLGIKNYPDMADTLDLSNKDTLPFVTDIFKEYLARDGCFGDCEAIHIGFDEYYGDYDDYRKYLNGLYGNLRDITDTKIRIWGSFTNENMDTSDIPRDIEIMVWNLDWTNPKLLYEDGFCTINALTDDLYIIPGGGRDKLDVSYLESTWEPNMYRNKDGVIELPAWSSKVKGAVYCLWNDYYIRPDIDNSSEEDLFTAFSEPLYAISGKLW